MTADSENIRTYTYDEAMAASREYFAADGVNDTSDPDSVDLPAGVFVDKYALRNNSDQIVEATPDDMHRREARELAAKQKVKYTGTSHTPFTEEEIYAALKDFGRIVAQGSPSFAIGNRYKYVSASNCFVIPSPEDSYGGIMKTDERIVQISKRRGGVGTDVSTLRPKFSPTTNSARTSTGACTFIKRFSNSLREVGQNGRRGAGMITMSIHHPEVDDFIRMKVDLTVGTGCNMSVRLTDEFMSLAVSTEETMYERRFPVSGAAPSIAMQASATGTWDSIITAAHEMAEPGVLFWDTIIRESPADCYADFGFRTISTNPCCFAADTDVLVLTDRGVKEIKSITADDKVFVNETGKWAETSGYFDAGDAEVFDVTFSNGTTLRITANHRLCVARASRSGGKVSYTEGDLVMLKDLKVGDVVSLHTSVVAGANLGNKGTYAEGLVMGSLTGDGCLSYHDDKSDYPDTILAFWQKEHDAAETVLAAVKELGHDLELSGNSSNDVRRIRSSRITEDFVNKYQCNIWKFKSSDLPNPFLLECSLDFVKGYLAGYFTADGHVVSNHVTKNYGVGLAGVNKALLAQVQSLLLLFGIKSSISLLREAGTASFEGSEYATKDCWRLSITGVDNIIRFRNSIGFLCAHKQSRLDEVVDKYSARKAPKCMNRARITSIEPAGVARVGCINVPGVGKFTANGIISGNSEIPLSAYDSCRLMLLNLFTYVKDPFTSRAKFDWRMFKQDARMLQFLMDDLVDIEIDCVTRILDKIDRDPEPDDTKAVERDLWSNVLRVGQLGRRTGSGITGLGDALAALGLKYASDEAIAVTLEIYKTLKLECYRASVEMAEILGPFPVFNASLEADCPFLLRIRDEDPELWSRMQKSGRRNIALLTTAPVGTLSTLTQTSSGIEPQFAQFFTRKRKGNPDDPGFRSDYTDANGDHWQSYRVFPHKIRMWMKVTGETDITKSPWHGATANDLDYLKRVELQAAAAKHVDHSISSTVNMPRDVSKEDVRLVYETAWRLGCKGITIYRDGCRDGVLTHGAEDAKKAKVEEADASDNNVVLMKKRPTTLPCDVHHLKADGVQYFVLVGFCDDGRPCEVFAGVNSDDDNDPIIAKRFRRGTLTKVGSGHYRGDFINEREDGEDLTIKRIGNLVSSEMGAITRLLSTGMREGVPLNKLVLQLERVRGDMHSFTKCIARVLKKYIPDGTVEAGETCSACGTYGSIVRQEGCLSCLSCGSSKCS